MKQKFIPLSALIACIASAGAQTTTPSSTSLEELVKLKQNPVSGLRQAILDVTLSPDVPVTGGTEASYSAQVVWPFPLGEDWRLITYTILPVLQAPLGNGDYEVGLGNTLLNLFAAPAKPDGKLVWGAGPTVLLPTRTDSHRPAPRLRPRRPRSVGRALLRRGKMGGRRGPPERLVPGRRWLR